MRIGACLLTAAAAVACATTTAAPRPPGVEPTRNTPQAGPRATAKVAEDPPPEGPPQTRTEAGQVTDGAAPLHLRVYVLADGFVVTTRSGTPASLVPTLRNTSEGHDFAGLHRAARDYHQLYPGEAVVRIIVARDISSDVVAGALQALRGRSCRLLPQEATAPPECMFWLPDFADDSADPRFVDLTNRSRREGIEEALIRRGLSEWEAEATIAFGLAPP